MPSSVFTDSQFTKLKKLGIRTELDLLLHLPSRYLDETKLKSINEIRPGELSQIQGWIIKSEVTYGSRKSLVVYIKDKTGELRIRFLNFYSSQVKQFVNGKFIRVIGEVKTYSLFYEMVHPLYKIIEEGTPLPDSYSPVYPITAGLSQKMITKLIQNHIELAKKTNKYEDLFPATYKEKYFPTFMEALENIHRPPKKLSKKIFDDRSSIYHQRVIYDEFLAQQLFFRGKYFEIKKHKAPHVTFEKTKHELFLNQLNFDLTIQQQQVFSDLQKDFTLGYPMNRLLQGDVGSGKTVVAVMAAIQVITEGYQVAFMVPTEILAEQHYEKIKEWLSVLSINVVLLIGGMKEKLKLITYEKIKKGEAELVIGTHALFQESVEFDRLGFYIIDEQHRFGVEQRIFLRKNNSKKQGYEAHQLMMSATPIPRTLSMSYFADMEISTINELPPGRRPIITKLFSDEKREKILEKINRLCLQGSQVYWVCPLIEESETLQLETAKKTYEDLTAIFSEYSVGLIHGRMKSNDKKEIMKKFQENKIQVLVATTVIEVGVDVPNATLMVIENSERMGLSQLHQLRGRIGRGGKEGVCILLYQKKLSGIAKQRLKIIYENIDGFKIAEEDLRLRGPGEFLGLKQSGLPSLKIGNLDRDEYLLDMAKKDADTLLNKHKNVSIHIDRWLKDYESLSRT
ncbi:MAG: ATP-dependent DNA helicase RecG [Methylophilaceae bacterium]